MKRDRLTVVAVAVAVMAMACGGSARAIMIIDQPNNAGNGIACQDFEATLNEYDCFAWDDFTLTQGYDLTQLTAYGSGGDSSFNVAVHLKIWDGSIVYEGLGTQMGDNLFFDLTGLYLDAGSYFLSAWVERPFAGGGQAFWNLSQPANGAEAMWHNPNGGFGLGTSQMAVRSVVGFGDVPVDLAFTLEGTAHGVPDAASACYLLSVALAGLGLMRRVIG